MDDDETACEIEGKIETINQLFKIKVDHLRSLRIISHEFSILNTADIEDDILMMETQIVKLVAELMELQNQLKGIERLVSAKITTCPELHTWLVAIGVTAEFRADILELFHTVEMLLEENNEAENGISLAKFMREHPPCLSDREKLTRANHSLLRIRNKLAHTHKNITIL